MSHLLRDTALVFRRCMRQMLRSKLGLVFGLLQPLLYLVLFGPLLTGVRLGTGGRSWDVLVPGLLVQLGLFSASFAGFAIIIEKHQGVLERMRVTPVSRLALLLGRVLRDVVKLVGQSVLLVAAGYAMGLRAPLTGVLIGLGFVAVLTVSLASLSYALAMKANTPQDFAPVVNAVNMPAMLLSGILLPMSLAPAWLDAVSHCVPFRYLVDAVRAAFLGHYGDGHVSLGVAVSAALAAVSITLGARLFTRSSV
jgi:ABC-2 type transport system permease protein